MFRYRKYAHFSDFLGLLAFIWDLTIIWLWLKMQFCRLFFRISEFYFFVNLARFIYSKLCQPERTFWNYKRNVFNKRIFTNHFSLLFQTLGDRKIVGLKYIDRLPTTKVEFLKGYLGDYQMTIKITAEGHGLDSTFIFYY